MSKSLTEHRVTQTLEKLPVLQDAAMLEPAIAKLLEVAASQKEPDIRWRQYESLKAIGTQLVGWEARNPALRTSVMYEALMRAIDELLPLTRAEVEADVEADTDDDWLDFDEE